MVFLCSDQHLERPWVVICLNPQRLNVSAMNAKQIPLATLDRYVIGPRFLGPS
jgi:hypothetical protein